MKLVGLLSWFDEDPAMLETAVRSACRIVDHLIAVDGRYALFEHHDVVSGPEQYDAIAGACQDSGTTCELVGVAAPWDGPHGGEVAKRAFMFERAEAVTTTADWHLVFDSDLEFIDPDVRTLRTRLADTNLDVGTAMVNHEGAVHPHPVFFRALRGLTVSERHWRYHVPGGPVLWDAYDSAEPLDTHRQVHVEHHGDQRRAGRLASRAAYYTTRDAAGIERQAVAPTPPPLTFAERQRHTARVDRMNRLLATVAGSASQ